MLRRKRSYKKEHEGRIFSLLPLIPSTYYIHNQVPTHTHTATNEQCKKSERWVFLCNNSLEQKKNLIRWKILQYSFKKWKRTKERKKPTISYETALYQIMCGLKFRNFASAIKFEASHANGKALRWTVYAYLHSTKYNTHTYYLWCVGWLERSVHEMCLGNQGLIESRYDGAKAVHINIYRECKITITMNWMHGEYRSMEKSSYRYRYVPIKYSLNSYSAGRN